jgi:hypothetical protein
MIQSYYPKVSNDSLNRDILSFCSSFSDNFSAYFCCHSQETHIYAYICYIGKELQKQKFCNYFCIRVTFASGVDTK